MPFRFLSCCAALLIGVLAFTPTGAKAVDDADYLRVGVGWWDMNRKDMWAPEFDLAYRSDYKWWVFKHHAGVLGTGDGSAYAYWGLYMDLYFGNRFVLSPSTAVGYYYRGEWEKGDHKTNLGHQVEFRSGIDLSYRFDDRSRLGLGYYHTSNTGLWSKRNPGEETLLLTYDLPISKLYSGWRSPGGNSPASQAAAQGQTTQAAQAKPKKSSKPR